MSYFRKIHFISGHFVIICQYEPVILMVVVVEQGKEKLWKFNFYSDYFTRTCKHKTHRLTRLKALIFYDVQIIKIFVAPEVLRKPFLSTLGQNEQPVNIVENHYNNNNCV